MTYNEKEERINQTTKKERMLVNLEELFQAAYDNCDAIDIQTLDTDAFVAHCEEVYGMTTDEFHAYFEANEREGSPTQQLWYRWTKERPNG